MFERLVEEIRKGGTIETTVLAHRLGTTPQLVKAMLEHLQRSGLIRSYANCNDENNYEQGCQGCGLKDSCSSTNSVRLWQSHSED